MEQVVHEKIEITLDTEIPELPAKKDILKEPSREVFDKDMALFDHRIS